MITIQFKMCIIYIYVVLRLLEPKKSRKPKALARSDIIDFPILTFLKAKTYKISKYITPVDII